MFGSNNMYHRFTTLLTLEWTHIYFRKSKNADAGALKQKMLKYSACQAAAVEKQTELYLFLFLTLVCLGYIMMQICQYKRH